MPDTFGEKVSNRASLASIGNTDRRRKYKRDLAAASFSGMTDNLSTGTTRNRLRGKANLQVDLLVDLRFNKSKVSITRQKLGHFFLSHLLGSGPLRVFFVLVLSLSTDVIKMPSCCIQETSTHSSRVLKTLQGIECPWQSPVL